MFFFSPHEPVKAKSLFVFFLKNALKLTESFVDYSLVFIKNVYNIAQRRFMLHKETTT